MIAESETITTEELRDLSRKTMARTEALANAKAEVKITHRGAYRPPLTWVVELESHRSEGCKFQVNLRAVPEEYGDEYGERYEIEHLLEVYPDGSVDVHKERGEFSDAILMVIENEIFAMFWDLWRPTQIAGYDGPITEEAWR